MSTSVARVSALIGFEGQVAPELEPDLGANVVEHRRLEAGALEALGHPHRTLAPAAVELAERQPVALDVHDDAGRRQLRSGVDHAAEHLLRREMAGECARRVDTAHDRAGEFAAMAMEVPELNTVLQGDDDRFRPDEPGGVGRDVAELVRLHREHDDVLGADGAVVVRRTDRAHAAALHHSASRTFAPETST